jgi:branched-chain amino acid transport system permease protein
MDILAFTILGLVSGAAYAIAASGLVLTYATSNVFNVAHGAVGMVMAFLYWELAVNRGLPTLVALVLVVGVAAPAFGYSLDKLVMRRLTHAPVAVTLVVTVGALVFLMGAAEAIWPPAGRRVDPFFGSAGLQLGPVFVSVHQMLTFVIAVAVAAGLYLLLSRTRTGIAMRAVVDDRDLVALHGARPGLLSGLSWAVGSALAALAGILLVTQVGMDYLTLTLLVINAYAAAMVGKLKSLPRTFVGALILGQVTSHSLLLLNRIPWDVNLSGLRAAMPSLFLFAVLLLLPQDRLRVGTITGTSLVRLPSRKQALLCGAGLVGVVWLLTGALSTSDTSRLGQALALSLIMLSLVLLTGYGGEVSLGQMAFVGVGVLVMAQLFGAVTPLSVLAAGLGAAVVGALVALPALRLKGLYLALGTLAFADIMDKLVFESRHIGFSLGGASIIDRPALFASERAFTMLITVSFVVLGMVVLELRRGRFGRLLLAARDSEAACGTLGLSIARTRVTVFAISAGLAGVAGALFGGMQVSVGPPDFMMFQGLLLLLLAVVGGITSITGALLGGLFLGSLTVLADLVPGMQGVVLLAVGFAAITLGDNPNGLASWIFRLGDLVRGRTGPSAGAPAAAAEEPSGDLEPATEPVREEVPVHGTS